MRSSAVLAALLLILASQFAPAQVRVGRDSSTRLNRFGRDLVYGTALGLAYAEVDQLRNEPPQWGSGWDGYRRRAASNIGEFVIQEGTTEALAAAMHRPLDYTTCPCRGTGDRLGWALWGSITDQMPNGKHPLAVPRIVGAYAGSFAQASWRPSASNRARTAVVNGTVSLLIGAGINLFQEFKR
ncbi:MAG TPA: hypothetical protein VGP84_00815 [Gemmatimonadaceae bacterium]|jgi:hypothetical protein|nr:hypothetical protein [Gemmatimonadaceae bacterium]